MPLENIQDLNLDAQDAILLDAVLTSNRLFISNLLNSDERFAVVKSNCERMHYGPMLAQLRLMVADCLMENHGIEYGKGKFGRFNYSNTGDMDAATLIYLPDSHNFVIGSYSDYADSDYAD